MPTEPSTLGTQAVPLLYGGPPGATEEAPLVTPSEEEMARHLAAQIAAAAAAAEARTPARQAAPAAPRPGHLVQADPSSADRLNAVPITAERAAELAALSPALPSGAARPAAAPASEPLVLPVVPAAGQRPKAPASPVAPAQPAAPAEAPLRQVGAYRLLSRANRGRAAPAYRAEHLPSGQPVLLHFLLAEGSDDEVLRNRLQAGAQAAAGLVHPGIVPVREVGEFEQRPFLVSDRPEAQTLAQQLETQPRLAVADVVTIGQQLARALAHAHDQGVVHRDIHAGNVLLLPDRSLKLAGFGVVQASAGAAAQALPPTWPEQVRGEALDSRCDQFSVGALLYEMLAGERPFRGDAPAALALRIAQEDPTPLVKLRPDLPAPLRRVVERCLAKQPAQRYASAHDLAQALLRVQAELDEAERLRQRPRRLPLRGLAAGALGLAAALVLGLAALLLAQGQQQTLLAQAGEQGRALAAVTAAQLAGHVLADEWPSVEAQVQEVMRTGKVGSVQVLDAMGAVRVSSPAGPAGAAGAPGTTAATPAAAPAPVTGPLLRFEAPVVYQGKPLGRLVLGLAEAPLTKAAHQAWLPLAAMAAAGVLGVVLAAYGLASLVLRPMRAATAGMADIAQGRLEHRLGSHGRTAEISDLNEAFDTMAQALQRREAGRDTLTRK